MTARLILIAHAPAQAQRHAVFPSDEPILQRPAVNFSGMSWKAPRADRICCAPELRARQTADLLGFKGAVAEELRDCDYGTWRGRRMDEVQAAEPEGVLAWLTKPEAAPHGGESVENLIDRVGKWMEAQISSPCTIAVTHPAVIRAAIVHALQIPAQAFWRFDVSPLTMTDLRFHRMWTVRCCGCSLTRTGQP